MSKHKLFCVWCCLMVALFPCNAFNSTEDRDEYSPTDDGTNRPPRFPLCLLKPLIDKLKWKDDWKPKVKKIKNKLEHKIAVRPKFCMNIIPCKTLQLT